MPAEYLSEGDAEFLRAYAAIDEARGVTSGPTTLRRIADQYSEPTLCRIRFPFSGFQGACDRPVGHELGTHRWTRVEDGWQVFWDGVK